MTAPLKVLVFGENGKKKTMTERQFVKAHDCIVEENSSTRIAFNYQLHT